VANISTLLAVVIKISSLRVYWALNGFIVEVTVVFILLQNAFMMGGEWC
jgi:hypothetical protein